MDVVVSKKMARRYNERAFIFSDKLLAKSELQQELDELEDESENKQVVQVAKGLVTVGGALGLVYGSIKGLSAIEGFIKQQELDDIAAEKELTGQYISVDASDVDTVFDPTTNKNLTLTKKNTTVAKTNVSEASEAPRTKTPWLLRKLGIDITDKDDDGFWTPPTPTASAPRNDGDGGGAAGGAAGGDGDKGTDGSDGAADDDGLRDDSSDVDALDDLLG